MKRKLQDIIHDLQTEGWNVEIHHKRNTVYKLDENRSQFNSTLAQKEVSPKGGYTAAFLEKDGMRFVGEAVCSKQDNYNRKIGAQIALGRALKKIEGLREYAVGQAA